jgi:tripartite ATP-independent transporter DctP family solute receptor
MFNKKTIICLIIICLLFSGLFTNSVIASVLELKWGSGNSKEHPWSIVSEKVINDIYNETEGRIKITIYYGGALGSEAEMVDMLRTGSLDLLTAGPTILTSYFDPVSVFALPYLFENREHARETFKQDFIDEWFNDIILKKSNVRTIAYWYLGTRTLTTRNLPVYKPEDLKGVKIRCMDVPISKDVIGALGASPTPVPFVELYLALQTGVVEGQENPIMNTYDMKFYEVQNYLIHTDHNPHIGTVHFSEITWQKISKEDREIIQKVFDKYNQLVYDLIDELDVKYIEEMKEKGMKIIEPDLKAFMEFGRDYIWERYKDKYGEYLLQINPNFIK